MDERKIILYHDDIVRLDAIKEYIDKNLCGELSIEFLSEKFLIHKSKLQRHFFAQYKEHIAYHIYKCRMAHAMAIVKEHTIPVSQIGMTVGYSHRAAFNRAFRKFFGKPPTYFLKTGPEN